MKRKEEAQLMIIFGVPFSQAVVVMEQKIILRSLL